MAKNFKLDATSYSLGLHYKVGNGRIMTSYSHQDDRTLSNSDVTQFAIGYDYNLSKRTDLYTVVGRIRNQNDGQYALGAASASGGFTETTVAPHVRCRSACVIVSKLYEVES